MSITTTLTTYKCQDERVVKKVQPRSSSERDNRFLLHSALKASTNDMAHRLLDYASLDKMDCEASCILIALSNHSVGSRSRLINKKSKDKESTSVAKENPNEDVQKNQEQKIQVEKKPVEATMKRQDHVITKKKNDPMMLLMAAAEVVDQQSKQKEQARSRKRYHSLSSHYPNGRYYQHSKSNDENVNNNNDNNKRIRTSPPTTPAPTFYKESSTSNSFSRQYHTMKQNPKVKQNALHTYITYMIYNDLAHGGGGSSRKQSTTNHQYINNTAPTVYTNRHNSNSSSLTTTPSLVADSSTITSPSSSSIWYPSQQQHQQQQQQQQQQRPPPLLLSDEHPSILSRPLTAFLWDSSPQQSQTKKELMILPPLNSSKRQSSFDRLPPV